MASALKLASPPGSHFQTAAFHCHQAAENAIKALLAHYGRLGERERESNNLLHLMEWLPANLRDLRDLRDAAAELNRFATAYRYPGEGMPVLSDESFEKMLLNAEEIMRRAAARISPPKPPAPAFPDESVQSPADPESI